MIHQLGNTAGGPTYARARPAPGATVAHNKSSPQCRASEAATGVRQSAQWATQSPPKASSMTASDAARNAKGQDVHGRTARERIAASIRWSPACVSLAGRTSSSGVEQAVDLLLTWVFPRVHNVKSKSLFRRERPDVTQRFARPPNIGLHLAERDAEFGGAFLVVEAFHVKKNLRHALGQEQATRAVQSARGGRGPRLLRPHRQAREGRFTIVIFGSKPIGERKSLGDAGMVQTRVDRRCRSQLTARGYRATHRSAREL